MTAFGYHDFGASGVVHAIAGFFTLGVLINLGARIGKFNPDGSANAIWLFLSVALCVAALALGAMHEKGAYKKAH